MKRCIFQFSLFFSFLAVFNYANSSDCFDRNQLSHTLQVDTHLHTQPFNNEAMPTDKLMSILNKAGIKYVNAYGIGQTFAVKTACKHYLDCPNTPIKPSWVNDFRNLKAFTKHKYKNIVTKLSMSFPDLANPENILQRVIYIQNKYPNKFKWVGEVNLIQHALLSNAHEPATISDINNWQPFMAYLRTHNLPLTLHADIGLNDSPFEYIHLMRHVLERYPDNKIVWAHMGLSTEQSKIDTKNHIGLMNSFLKNHPNLTLDISSTVLEENFFSRDRTRYVALINKYPSQFINGTDFLAYENFDFEDYDHTLKTVSEIHKYINDEAFRNIALGQNYFNLLGLQQQTPRICKS
ncbi:amidohydrolase family protein [Shewanella sp. 202IG2-18]|uniref:amidohydrolase family protein n=1 Tax=Parashewanella hymeniacidonis TaxID=2807618 RepID=UPI001961426F|nr:amidohydrolase family protein [Parashewanella hymeniacidonis]MBM7073738.1 amidohydrolase family protein [Parashewanella hymeniacidonis]